MRKKKNTPFRAFDLVIVLLCCAGAITSGVLFWKEYNRTLTKLNEEPIGTIVFKKRTAQRKFSDRVVWDTLKQESPVYNGDTIRTIDQSEASITFRDQVTTLTLIENTLIQIFFNDQQGARIDFSTGSVEVFSGVKSVAITTGTSSIVVEGAVSLNKDDESLGVSVLEGQINIDGKELAEGGILALDSGGQEYAVPLIAMTSLGSSTRIVGAPAPVLFAWNSSNFEADTHVIVQVAADRSYRNIVESRDVTGVSALSISLESGAYWWRAFPAARGSGEPQSPVYPTGTLEMIPAAVVELLSPPRASEFTVDGSASVSFSWSGVEGAASYLIEISVLADMGSPFVSRYVQGTGVTQTGLQTGNWYWRITPVFPSWVRGSVPPSAVGNFAVVRGKPVLAAPQLTFPLDEASVSADVGRRLLWIHDPAAASWLVELADNPALRNPVIAQNVVTNYFSLPAEVMDAGKTWYWRVSALGGDAPALSPVRSFGISGREPPPPVAAVIPETPPPPPAPEPEPEPEPVAPPPAPAPPPPPPPPPSRPTPTPPPPRPAPPPQTPPPAPPPPPPAAPVEPPPHPPVAPVEPPPPAVPPAPPPPALPTPEETLRRLLQVSQASTVSGNIPADGHTYTVGQLESAPTMSFAWNGRSSQYWFALYRTSGQQLIAPVLATASPYIFTAPRTLTEGNYVWHIYEMDSQGRRNTLPSTACRFTVVRK